MKKKILSLAILAISALSFTVMAQEPQQTCDIQKKECRAQKPGKPGKGGRNLRGGRHASGLGTMRSFEGITLTEAQKTSIEALNKEYVQSRRPACCQDSAQCAKPDREKAVKMKESRKESRLAYLRKVQKVLTPEQYVTFLENNVAGLSGAFGPDRKGDVRPYGNRMRRGDGKRVARGMRPASAPTPATPANNSL